MRVSRELASLAIARIIQVALGIASLKLATTFLPVEQYGLLALLMSIYTLFGLFLINPVGQHINRHTHAWHADGSLVTRLRQYNTFIAFVALLGFLVVWVWLDRRVGMTNDTLMLFLTALSVAAMIYFGTWNATLVFILNMLGQRMISAGLAVATLITSLGISCVLTWYKGIGSMWLSGQALGMAFVALAAAWYVNKNRPPKVNPRRAKLIDWKIVKSFCMPLAMATGFLWLLTSGYRFAVEEFWGIEALGFLVVGIGISGQLWAVCESLAMQFIYPYFFKTISQPQQSVHYATYNNLLNMLIPIYILAFGCIFSCGAWSLAILTDVKFHDAYIFTFMGAGIEFCRVLASLLSQAAQVTKRTDYVIAPYVLSATVALSGLLLVGWYGAPLIAVGWVLLIAGIVLVGAMVFQMQRLLPLHLDWRRILKAVGMTILIFLLAQWIGLRLLSLTENFLAILGVGFMGLMAMYYLLKDNPGYHALVSVKLMAEVSARNSGEKDR